MDTITSLTYYSLGAVLIASGLNDLKDMYDENKFSHNYYQNGISSAMNSDTAAHLETSYASWDAKFLATRAPQYLTFAAIKFGIGMSVFGIAFIARTHLG